MEEKMFRCLIHHQCDIVKSIPLRSVGTVPSILRWFCQVSMPNCESFDDLFIIGLCRKLFLINGQHKTNANLNLSLRWVHFMPKCRNWTAFDPEGAACMGDSGTERSGAERGNIEWLEKLQCSHQCQKHSAPLRWNCAINSPVVLLGLNAKLLVLR